MEAKRLNNKHRETLAAIFLQPVSGNLAWSKIEKLLVALGATITEGNGSRVRFTLNNARINAHRPHPGKEAKEYQVRAVRNFLSEQGIKP